MNNITFYIQGLEIKLSSYFMFTKKIDNHFFLALTIFIFGIFIAYDRSSNFSDGDAYSLINSYLGFFIDGNTYSPSRGAYGHPIPEIFIGFI